MTVAPTNANSPLASEFGSPDELARQIAYTANLDLLVEDYAEHFVHERDVAQGFIREMAQRVAGDEPVVGAGEQPEVDQVVQDAAQPLGVGGLVGVDLGAQHRGEQRRAGRSGHGGGQLQHLQLVGAQGVQRLGHPVPVVGARGVGGGAVEQHQPRTGRRDATGAGPGPHQPHHVAGSTVGARPHRRGELTGHRPAEDRRRQLAHLLGRQGGQAQRPGSRPQRGERALGATVVQGRAAGQPEARGEYARVAMIPVPVKR